MGTTGKDVLIMLVLWLFLVFIYFVMASIF